MSKASVLYRFRLDVADVDRSVYEALEVRLALHASESVPFLLTRLFAYALNLQPGLAFSPEGLANPDDPCISSEHPRGGKDLWIEVGNPSSRRLHKAAKAARQVKIYTYKNPEALLAELRGEKIHEAEKIEIYSLDAAFLEQVEALLTRNNTWGLLRDQGSLVLSAGEQSVQGELRAHRL